jgi:hypothetical protein
MKKEYRLGEDIFLIAATFLIGAAIIMKFFDVSWNLGLSVIYPMTLVKLGVISLLFNIALNIQELTHK